MHYVLTMLCVCFIILAFYADFSEGLVKYDFNVHGEDQHGYYISISLGTPPQEINLLLDTGSSNIAIAVVPTNTGSMKYFRYNESQTLRPLDIAVDLRYIVGQWNGFLAKEIVYVGSESIEITVACMVSIKQIFDENSQFQGLLGLAYPSIAIPDASVEPFFDKLTETQNMSRIFCLDLCGPYFTSQKQTTSCGNFHMGYISRNYSNDDIFYTPIIKEWYYEVMLSGLRVGKNHAPVSCRELNKDRTVIDSGTTELYLPEPVYHWTVKEIKKHMQTVPNDYWVNETVACFPNNEFEISVFPPIILSFYHTNNSTFNLIVTSELYLLRIKNQYDNETCFKLALSIADRGTLIGSSILKGFFVVFDRQNKRIGFANSNNFNRTTGFPGSVMRPKYTNQIIKWCKNEEIKSDSVDITPLMIVLLCFAVIISIVLLYMLVSWIFKHFFMHSDDSSETSSLVDGIVLETLR